MKKLRVALETQFAYGTPTGLGVYAAGLHAALRQRDDVEVIEVADAAASVWSFPRRILWDQVSAPRRARAARPDVTHFTGGTLPLRAPHPCVLTLHDVAWLRGAVPARMYARWYFGRLQRTLVTQADRIAADSQAARSELLQQVRLQPQHVIVTGAGVEESYFGVERNVAQPPYLLNVGTVEQRKNLAAALPLLVEHPDLVLVSAGPHTPYARELRHAAQGLGVEDRLRLLGFVAPDALLALYAGALAFVFPSTYEGFGLPPLQALAAGLPVIAADIAVLREVLDSCAWFAAPSDQDALVRALREIRNGGTAVDARVAAGRSWARGYTWSAVADRMTRLYRSIA